MYYCYVIENIDEKNLSMLQIEDKTFECFIDGYFIKSDDNE